VWLARCATADVGIANAAASAKAASAPKHPCMENSSFFDLGHKTTRGVNSSPSANGADLCRLTIHNAVTQRAP
jgi:hypothetical protein